MPKSSQFAHFLQRHYVANEFVHVLQGVEAGVVMTALLASYYICEFLWLM